MEYIVNSAADIFTGVIDLNKRIAIIFVTRPAAVLHHILLCCDMVCSVRCYSILYDTMPNCIVKLESSTAYYIRVRNSRVPNEASNTKHHTALGNKYH